MRERDRIATGSLVAFGLREAYRMLAADCIASGAKTEKALELIERAALLQARQLEFKDPDSEISDEAREQAVRLLEVAFSGFRIERGQRGGPKT